MNDNMIEVRYKLLAQYADDRLRVEDVKTRTQFVLPASQIACNEQLIAYFSGQDACAIGYIMAAHSDK